MKKQLLTLGFALSFAVPSFASGVYGIVDVGQSKMELSLDGWNASKTDTAADLGIGFDLNKNFAIELAYRNLGELKTSDDFGYFKVTTKATQASVVGKTAVSDKLNLFGRLGYAKLEVDSYDSYFDEHGSDSANKIVYGVGAEVKANDKLSVRLEYTRYAKWDGVTISSMTAGLKYNF